MTHTGFTSDEELRQAALLVLERAPVGSIPAPIARSLSTPTFGDLEAAANALLAGKHLDQAETVFRFLEVQLGFEVRSAAALARIATTRGDAAVAAKAWQECLGRFEDRAEPYWFGELARAERQLGRDQDAEATLRKCLERFPEFGPASVQLAELLLMTGRSEEAAVLCQAAIQRSSDQAEPWWFTTLVSALQASGNSSQIEQALEQMALRFPKAQATLVMQAQHAARNEDWGRTLAFWTTCIELYADSAEPYWLNARAMALFRLLRVEEAMEAWREVINRFPEFIHGYSDMAAAAEALGQREMELELLSQLIARFPGCIRPDWLARRARCLMNPRPDPAIHQAISELEAKFPDSSLASRVAVDLARRMNHSVENLAVLIADAVRRFPDDRRLLSEQVIYLIVLGRLSEAETIVQQLESGEDDHFALISRWRITIDQSLDGFETIRDSAREAALRDSWSLDSGLAIGEFLLSAWTSWANDLALSLHENLMKRFPGKLAVICALARTLVVHHKDKAALELIDAVPAACQSRTMLEFKAWACAKRGDNEMARQHWQTILAENYIPEVHSPEPNLELVSAHCANLGPEDIAVFFQVRNELVNLDSFLRHYRKLGVRRFVAVDNLSTDGSGEFLLAQNDVILYRTGDDRQIAGSGTRWINALIERHGAGGWCLFADADEAFIYPGWESLPIGKLIEFLDGEGAEAVAAFMLDVYPDRLIDSTGDPATHADAQYYDGNYEWIGHVRPPYQRPVGGVRSRLFRTQEFLHKIPLIKSSRGVHIHNHETTSLQFSGVSGALLHYKLTALAYSHGRDGATSRCLEVKRRYSRYGSRWDEMAHADLRRPGVTQKLTDSFTLSDRGVMRAPDEYRAWAQRLGSCSSR